MVIVIVVEAIRVTSKHDNISDGSCDKNTKNYCYHYPYYTYFTSANNNEHNKKIMILIIMITV